MVDCYVYKILFVFSICIIFCNCQNYDLPTQFGFCADPLCTVPISLGLTSTLYNSPDPSKLSFTVGVEVPIFAVKCGRRSELLGVEIDGRKGYVPASLIQEIRFYRPASFPISTDFYVLSTISAQATAQELASQTHSVSPIANSIVSSSVSQPEQLISSPDILGSHSSITHQDYNTLNTGQLSNSHFVAPVNYPSASHFQPPPITSNQQIPNMHSFVNTPSNAFPAHDSHAFPDRNAYLNHPNTFNALPSSHLYSQQPDAFHPVQNDMHSMNHILGIPGLTNTEQQNAHGNLDITQSLQENLGMGHSHPTQYSNVLPSPQIVHSSIDTPSNLVPSAEHYSNNVNAVVENQFSQQSTAPSQNIHDLNPNSHISPSLPVDHNIRSHTLPIMSSDVNLLTGASMQGGNNQADPSIYSANSDSTSFATQTNHESVTDSLLQEAEDHTKSLLEKWKMEDSLNIDDENQRLNDNREFPNTQEFSKTPSQSIHSTYTQSQTTNQKDKPILSAKESENLEKEIVQSEVVKVDAEDTNKNIIASENDDNNEFEVSEDEERDDGANDMNFDSVGSTLPLEKILQSAEESIKEKFEKENSKSPSDSILPEIAQPEKSSEELINISNNEITDTDLKHDKDLNFADFNLNPYAINTEENEESTESNQITDDIANEITDFYDATKVKGDEHSPWVTRNILQDDNSSLTESDIVNGDTNKEKLISEVVDKEKLDFVETDTASDVFTNFVYVLRTFLDYIITFIPEPLYSCLMDLNASGISTRAVVFTAIMSVPCVFFFLSAFYLKESSREQQIIGKLSKTEHQLYLASTERDLCRENIQSLEQKVTELEVNLQDEKSRTKSLEGDVEEYQLTHQNVSAEQKENITVIRDLKKQIKDYEITIGDLEKSLKETTEKLEQSQDEVQDEKENSSSLNKKNDDFLEDIRKLQSEKETFIHNEKLYADKITEYEEYCNQLCQDAEIRTTRINELSEEITRYATMKEELEIEIGKKDSEIESLRSAVLNMDVLQKFKDSEASEKSVEEKLMALLDISALQNKLKKAEAESEVFSAKLNEKTKECDEVKVVNLELNSEVEKLKVLTDQAMEEKIEVQRKLEILEKYFKDKEVQLQKELGTQLTARQQNEKDVSQAERTIFVLQEENVSLREQVKTLKQEVVETERNLKKQITAQEEVAHKNWVAARAAERNADKFKQEATQFRQRLTLLERERENWNSSEMELVKPIPQRISDSLHNISQDDPISGDFKSDIMLQRPIPSVLPPMLHPLMPPPPMGMAPFMRPPFDTMMPPPPRRPPPWHLMQDKSPPDFDRRRTPSDYRHSSMSPPGESSHSRNSSPLPDFHNVPPPASRYHDGPPPPSNARFVPPPPHMRDRELHRRDRELEYNSRSGNKSIDKESRKDSQQSTLHDRDYNSPRHHYDADV